MTAKKPDVNADEIVELIRAYVPDVGDDVMDKKLDALGISSMDFVSLVFDVEEKYGVEIDLANVNMSMSVRELIEDLG